MGTSTDNVNIKVTLVDLASKELQSIRDHFTALSKGGTEAGSSLLSLAGKFGLYTGVVELAKEGMEMLKEAIKDTIEAASKEEEQWIKTTSAIRGVHGNVNQLLPTIQAMTDLLEDQTNVADTLISQGFNKMVTALIPANKQFTIMKTALNIQAAGYGELNGVVDAFIKYTAGSEMMLKRLSATMGITVEDGESLANVIEKINQRIGNTAQDAIQGYAGQVKQLQIEIEHLEEYIGGKVIPTLTSFFAVINKGIDDWKGLDPNLPKTILGVEIVKQLESARQQIKVHITELIKLKKQAESMGFSWMMKGYEEDIQREADRFEAITNQINTLNATLAATKDLDDAQQKLAADFGVAKGVSLDFGAAIAIVEQDFIHAYNAAVKFNSEVAKVDKLSKKVGTDAGFRIPTRQEMNPEVYDENGKMKTVPEGQYNPHSAYVKASEETTKQISKLWLAMADTIQNSMNQLGDGLVESMFGAEVDFSKIFENIAKDFIKLFVDAALNALAGFVLKSLGLLAIFDKPANDAMAVRIGEDYAKYFSQGALNYLKTFAPNVLKSIYGQLYAEPAITRNYRRVNGDPYTRASQQHLHFHGMVVTTREFTDHFITPRMEEGAGFGRNRFSLNTSMRTGGRDREYAPGF